MPEGIEHCANCGRPIGKLETPHLFQEHVVCAECEARLSRQSNPRPIEEMQPIDMRRVEKITLRVVVVVLLALAVLYEIWVLATS